ncbi:MAG: FG-GAP repeat domain-containing protein, partial [Candidatus Latescibacterota bacterium]
DNDGDLDLFVANYVAFSPDQNVYCARGNVHTYCDPDEFPAQADILYRNDGERYTDVTQSMGLTHIGRGLGVTTSDYDGDGDIDLYVANDGTMNFFYENRGAFFSEVSLETGTRFNGYGQAEAGMGVDWADYDNDGDTDLYVTNFSAETNTLYQNNGGHFSDVTQLVGIDQPTYAPLGFGTH